MRQGFFILLVFFCLGAVRMSWAATDDARVVFLKDGQLHFFVARDDGRAVKWQGVAREDALTRDKAELGSLWKVFFYSFAVATDLHVDPYDCHDPQNAACACGPGGEAALDLDAALIHSCEEAFLIFREKASAVSWHDFWQGRFPENGAPEWLTDFSLFGARTRATPGDILAVFRLLQQDEKIFVRLRAALSRVPREGTASRLADSSPSAGVLLKTFTMGDRVQGYHGGFAGWLDESTLVWVGAPQRGAVVAETWFDSVRTRARDLFGLETVASGTPEVCVNFLNDYPLKAITNKNGDAVGRGMLFGTFTATTERGSLIEFTTYGRIRLTRDDGRLKLRGCFPLEEYIARVVEREGDELSLSAKKALAITARTYVLDEAMRSDDGNLVIDDDSRKQRVQLSDPRQENLQVAQETQGLVLSGQVLYHLDERRSGTLTIRDAERQAQSGLSETEILKAAFPSYTIMPMWHLTGVKCERMAAAEEWLVYNLPAWKSRLAPLGADLTFPTVVCRSRAHQAYFFGRKIFVPDFANTDDQLTTAHEWLHGAFAGTPLATDDTKIEALARELVLGDSWVYDE